MPTSSRSSELPPSLDIPEEPSSSSSPTELTEQWLRRISNSSRQPIPSAPQFHEGIILKPIKVLVAQPGRFVCSFLVPAHLTVYTHDLLLMVTTPYDRPSIQEGKKPTLLQKAWIQKEGQQWDRLNNSSQELHQGVIASLVDDVGAATLVSLDGKARLSVDINVSYVSPAHIDDEVEIEAKVLKHTKSIGVVAVDLTNKKTGQLVAQGRHTMFYSMSML